MTLFIVIGLSDQQAASRLFQKPSASSWSEEREEQDNCEETDGGGGEREGREMRIKGGLGLSRPVTNHILVGGQLM